MVGVIGCSYKRVNGVSGPCRGRHRAQLIHVALVRDLIRDDPRRGIRVMQVQATGPCQR